METGRTTRANWFEKDALTTGASFLLYGLTLSEPIQSLVKVISSATFVSFKLIPMGFQADDSLRADVGIVDDTRRQIEPVACL